MSIKEKKKNIIQGALETVSNFKSALNSKKETKNNLKQLAIKMAQKQYGIDNNGEQMTPSKLKLEYEGGLLSESAKQYENNKNRLLKELKNKYLKNK